MTNIKMREKTTANHKIIYMLFATVIKSIFGKKAIIGISPNEINPRRPIRKNGLMIENVFRFNIKLVLLGLGTTSFIPLRIKKWYSIKCVIKTNYHLKIMKF